MPVEISLNTPLADALTTAIQPKLVEVGWGTGGSDDSALAEYITLMLVNGKTQDQIAAELSGELLSLPADDPGVLDFSKWLFDQIDSLNAQLNGGPPDAASAVASNEAMTDAPSAASLFGDTDTDMMANDVTEPSVPTGPRSMRNGAPRGGRDKRMLGHLNKAMDRSGDGALHRVRGNDRVNTHGRSSQTGARNGQGRMARHNNTNLMNNLHNAHNRAGGLQAGLPGPGMPQGPGWMMQGQQPNQMEILAMLEQQNQMMFQLSQQLMNGGGGGGPSGGQPQQGWGKSLFERVSEPAHHRHRKGGHGGPHHSQGPKTDGARKGDQAGDGDEVEMQGDGGEGLKAEETVCKYNLSCTNKDCKYAHQSPAAPPGISVDVSDRCSFGAACKNRKCVGRHPSPAARLAHQSEQDCKFFPNCQNPRCPFRHPSMPLCRNGPDCTTANCKFTHVKTKCRFNPCLNPSCVFAHDQGQQGGFKDKVWTADGPREHVSERRFVDEAAPVERVEAGEAMATDGPAPESAPAMKGPLASLGGNGELVG